MPKSPAKRRATPKRTARKGKTARAKGVHARAPHKTTKRAAPAVSTPERVEQPSAREEALYLETLIENGQAARPGDERQLPDATHSIVLDDTGKLKAVRRRFSAY